MQLNAFNLSITLSKILISGFIGSIDPVNFEIFAGEYTFNSFALGNNRMYVYDGT